MVNGAGGIRALRACIAKPLDPPGETFGLGLAGNIHFA
jgi:hypothetical protein